MEHTQRAGLGAEVSILPVSCPISISESIFVQVLSAGKNATGPSTWGRDRAGQRRVQPGGLAQGKAGVGPRRLGRRL